MLRRLTRGSLPGLGVRFGCSDITPENAQELIDKWVKENKVVVFMKGTPEQPRCGFSNLMVQLLRQYSGRADAEVEQFKAVNVLANPVLREEVKKYRDWPTFPQLYIAGELVGGSDVLMEMHKEDQLEQLLKDKGVF